jgi:hypothetical protein
LPIATSPRAPCTRASRSPAGSRTPGFPGRRLQRRRGTANGAQAHGAILCYCYGACYRIGKDLRSVLRVDNRALTSLHRRRQQPTGYIDEPPPPAAVSSSDRSRGRPATATDRSIGCLVCPGAARSLMAHPIHRSVLVWVWCAALVTGAARRPHYSLARYIGLLIIRARLVSSDPYGLHFAV